MKTRQEMIHVMSQPDGTMIETVPLTGDLAGYKYLSPIQNISWDWFHFDFSIAPKTPEPKKMWCLLCHRADHCGYYHRIKPHPVCKDCTVEEYIQVMPKETNSPEPMEIVEHRKKDGDLCCWFPHPFNSKAAIDCHKSNGGTLHYYVEDVARRVG